MSIHKFDSSIITNVAFDVDGTLYNKSREHVSGRGSIQDSHDFFRFLAYERLERGDTPSDVQEDLSSEYKNAVSEGTLSNAIAVISEEIKRRYLALVEQHGSNGKVFVEEFGTDSAFLHHLLGNIDFDSLLARDHLLIAVVDALKKKGIKLGVLTTEIFNTAKQVFEVLGLDLDDFKINTGDGYGILCAENVKNKKPSPDGYERLKQIWRADDSRSIAYVGDHFGKDIEAALKMGLQAIHVLNSGDGISIETATVDDIQMQYAKIGNIYCLKRLLIP